MRFDRFFDRKRNARKRRAMKNSIDSGECRTNGIDVAYIGDDQFRRMSDAVSIASGEVVDDSDSRSAFQECVDEVRSDKAGATGYQHKSLMRRNWSSPI